MNDIHNLGQSGSKTLEFNLYPRKCLIKIHFYYVVEPVIAQISEKNTCLGLNLEKTTKSLRIIL